MTPRVRRESRLLRELGKERLAVEAPLGRDLRQKQTAPAAELEDQSVAADDDLLDVFDEPRRGEDGNLYGARGKLVGGERRKARVLERRAQGEPRDRAREIALRRERADTPPEPAAALERDEERPRLSERLGAVRRETRRRLPAELRLERRPREIEELAPRLLRQQRGNLGHRD